MYTQNRNNIERHVKTHSQRSDEDRSAVTILETFLRANGKISTNFSKEDKWPNIDGTLDEGFQNVTTRLAWERSLLNLDTKYLGTFLRGLQYIGNRIPDDGQSERLMLKYYDFLWQIRKSFEERYGVSILQNLEKFPLTIDKLDYQYYQIVSEVIESTPLDPEPLGVSRFYIQKKVPFFIGKERYYELTLQLAGVYATKYNPVSLIKSSNQF